MSDSSSDIKNITDSEYFSKDGTSKKKWQTPELMEMDYSQTSAGVDFIADGGGFSS